MTNAQQMEAADALQAVFAVLMSTTTDDEVRDAVVGALAAILVGRELERSSQ